MSRIHSPATSRLQKMATNPAMVAFAVALALAGCANKKNLPNSAGELGLGASGAGAATPGSAQDFTVNVGDRIFFLADPRPSLVSVAKTGALVGITAEYDAPTRRLTLREGDTVLADDVVRLREEIDSDFFAFRTAPGRIVDGPFAETKELVAGFWLWEVENLDEAVAWAKRCPNPMPGPSELEIRPFYEVEDFGDVLTPEIVEQHGLDVQALLLKRGANPTLRNNAGLSAADFYDTARAAFARVAEYIAAGDCYQINLTFPMQTRLLQGSALGLYGALRARQAVGRGAYVDLGAGPVLVSRSPELFINVTAAGRIEARPMKGTAPRDADPFSFGPERPPVAHDGRREIIEQLRAHPARYHLSGQRFLDRGVGPFPFGFNALEGEVAADHDEAAAVLHIVTDRHEAVWQRFLRWRSGSARCRGPGQQ